MAPLNRKRTRLSIGEKLEALRMIRSGYNNQKIMDKFNISARSVRNIKSQGDQLLERANDEALSTNRKSFRQAKYATIDKKVLAFCELARTASLPVTLDVIIQRALLEQEKILKNKDVDEDTKDCVRQFCASKCWVVKFVRRHTLKSVSVHGQGASVDVAAAARDISQLRRRLGEYEPANIYNVDEIVATSSNVNPPNRIPSDFAWYDEDETMERWMDMEKEAEIQEAIVLDSVVEIEKSMVHMGLNDEDDNDSDVEFIPAELPSLHKLYEAARPLEQLLLSCGLQSAGKYVKRAVDVARSNIMKENGGQKTQMLITDVLRFR